MTGNSDRHYRAVWHETNKRGHRYVLVAIDLFTRAAEIVPIPDKSAKTAASSIIRDVFCKRGISESLLTDCGCEFDNLTLGAIAHELGIDKKRISALHPQANGTVERLNRTIGDMLRKATNTHGGLGFRNTFLFCSIT